MIRVIILVVALSSLAFAPAPFPSTAKDDLKRMQGEWKAVTYKSWVNTKQHGVFHYECENIQLIIAEELLKFSQNGRPLDQYVFRLRDSKKLREIDSDQLDAGGRRVGNRWGRTGVYKLKGDTLIICDTALGNRPVSLTGDKQWERLIVLKRVKR